MTEPLEIPCQACGHPMIRIEEFSENRVRFDMYKCPDEGCARKVGVIWEPAGGFEAEEQNFVQREIARRGSFFPSDFTGSRIGRLR